MARSRAAAPGGVLALAGVQATEYGHSATEAEIQRGSAAREESKTAAVYGGVAVATAGHARRGATRAASWRAVEAPGEGGAGHPRCLTRGRPRWWASRR